MKKPSIPVMIITGVISVIVLTLFIMGFTTVPAGQVGVVTNLGKVDSEIMKEGFNFKMPWHKVTLFDARQKTHKETVGVPSMDRLITTFDISIQYKLIAAKAPEMLKNTGTPKEVFAVHMQPLLRSKVRELGKTIETAEEFFLQATQDRIQSELHTELATLSKHGLQVDRVLIRNIKLPKVLQDAVLRKKKAAEDAEKAKEDLRRFEIDQQKQEAEALAKKKAEIVDAEKKAEVAKTEAEGKKVALLIEATAKKEAAAIEAEALIIMAEAEKKSKELIVESLGSSDNYLKLEMIKVLPDFIKGNHTIIMDPTSTSPLPFLNLGK
jgi:regulator of protease activity HflC (stomatin/prohibitin superfamily)